MIGQVFSYKITDAGGVLKFRAVVIGTNAGEVIKPTAAGVGKCVGFTQEDQATQNRSVSVKQFGRSFGVASAAIAYGDAVDIADATGKIRSAQTRLAAAPGVAEDINVVGYARTVAAADGDIIEVDIAIFTAKRAVS